MKKLRVGILGTGSMAGTMARAISRMKNIEVAAVASRTPDKAERFAADHKIPVFYGTYEELYQDPSVDLVYIVSPHSHHAQYASECIRSGKPCIVEKSFTANAREAEELISLAEKKKVFLAEAIWTRYMPMVGMIREAVFSGKIGKVNAVTANLGYAVSGNKRVSDPSLCGGALLDVGIYALTFVSLLFGDELRDLVAVADLSDQGVDLRDHISYSLETSSGRVSCSVYCSITGPTDRNGIIYGTDGYIVVGNVNNYQYLEVFDSAHRLIERIEAPAQEETGYVYQFESCRKALSDGKLECPEMPHAEIIKIMEIMDRIRKETGVRYQADR